MRILKANFQKNMKTLALMDNFEGIMMNESKQVEKIHEPYHQLHLRSSDFCITSGEYIYEFDIIVERPGNNSATDGLSEISFSEFKKKPVKIVDFIDQQVRDTLEQAEVIRSDDVIRLNTPYILKAQNSMNRTGYGWEWDWSDGYGKIVHEGKKYGETTAYLITGISITRILENYYYFVYN